MFQMVSSLGIPNFSQDGGCCYVGLCLSHQIADVLLDDRTGIYDHGIVLRWKWWGHWGLILGLFRHFVFYYRQAPLSAGLLLFFEESVGCFEESSRKSGLNSCFLPMNFFSRLPNLEASFSLVGEERLSFDLEARECSLWIGRVEFQQIRNFWL